METKEHPQLPNPKLQFGNKKPCFTNLPTSMLIPLSCTAKLLKDRSLRDIGKSVLARVNAIMEMLIYHYDKHVDIVHDDLHPVFVAIVHAMDLMHDILEGVAEDDRPEAPAMSFDVGCVSQSELLARYTEKKIAEPFIAGSDVEKFSMTGQHFEELHFDVLLLVAVAMQEGALKYGKHNYRSKQYRILVSTYIDAAFRHEVQFGYFHEDKDAESGLHHVVKLLASLFVLGDSINNDHNLTDDRPIPSA